VKSSRSVNPGHEATDASLKLIGIMAASLAIGIGAVLLAAYGIVAAGGAGPSSRAGLGSSGRFQNGPQERTGISLAWADIAAQSQRRLHTYGWVDQPAGIVRIPIDRAIDLMAARAAAPATPESSRQESR
jgi:hypothetical protein